MRFAATPQAESIEAFPLHWPASRPRCKNRQRSDFHRKKATTWRRPDNSTYTTAKRSALTVADSRDRLLKELGMLGAGKVIISSNLELGRDGLPTSRQTDHSDPGIAVYFTLRNVPHCLSCDSWDRAADNLAALAKHVEAMRGQLRWGVADIASMFAGFKALPNAIVTAAAMTVDEAARMLASFGAFQPDLLLRDRKAYDDAYKTAAKKLHPDLNGGIQSPDWNRLQEAAKLIEQHQAR